MKYIFFLLLLPVVCFSQSKTRVNLGSKNTVVTFLDGVAADSILQVPTGCGAPGNIDRYQIVSHKGAIYHDSCSGDYYLYNMLTDSWGIVGIGGTVSLPLHQIFVGTGASYTGSDSLTFDGDAFLLGVDGVSTTIKTDISNHDFYAGDIEGQITGNRLVVVGAGYSYFKNDANNTFLGINTDAPTVALDVAGEGKFFNSTANDYVKITGGILANEIGLFGSNDNDIATYDKLQDIYRFGGGNLIVLNNGAFQAASYGSGTITGTPTFYAAFDATGNIIESNPSVSPAATITWSVLDILGTAPGTPSTGDKYLVASPGTGFSPATVNQIAEWSGSAWVGTTATVGDLLEDEDVDGGTGEFTYKYTGSAWLQVGKPVINAGLNNYPFTIKIGSSTAQQVQFRYNNSNRITLGGANGVTFNQLTGASTGLMGLSTTGVASNVQVGSGLSLVAGTLSATGGGGTVTSVGLSAPAVFSVTGSPVTGSGTLSFGWTGISTGDMLYASSANTIVRLPIGSTGQHLVVAGGIPVWRDTAAVSGSQSWQQTLDVSAAVNKNNTITGAFTLAVNTSRWTSSNADSISFNATNSATFNSLGTTNIYGVTLTGRATTSTITATNISTFASNTGTGDSTGWHMQLSGGRVGTYWLGATAFGTGANSDSLVTYNSSTKKISYSSPNSFVWWTRAGTGATQRLYPTNTNDSVNIGTNATNQGALFTVTGTAKVTSSMAVGTSIISTAGLNVQFSNSTDLFSGVRGTLSSSGSGSITQQGVLGGVNDNGGAGSGKFLYGVYGTYTAQAGSGTAGTGGGLFGEAILAEAPATTVGNIMFGVASRFQLGNSNVVNSIALNVYGFWGRSFLNNSAAADSARNYHAIHLDSILTSLVSGSNAWIFQKGTNSYGFIAGKTLHGYTSTGDTIPTMQLQVSGRFGMSKGADVTAANDLTLGSDGNLFKITGNTTINAITTTNWIAGSVIRLYFSGTPTVKNNTAGGANTAVMLLSGGADFSATANDVLTLVYDGTEWLETGRSVN